MTKGYWQEALKIAQAELEEKRGEMAVLDEERAAIASQIVQLERAIEGLSPLASDRAIGEKVDDFLIENATEFGLADACREVLKKTNKYLSPIQIRDNLDASGFDLTNYSNPLASIHGILKRFDESGEVSSVALGNRTAYRIARAPKAGVPQPDDPEVQALVERMRENRKRRQDAAMIDQFVGHGSAPSKIDSVITNPPYATKKQGEISVPPPKPKPAGIIVPPPPSSKGIRPRLIAREQPKKKEDD